MTQKYLELAGFVEDQYSRYTYDMRYASSEKELFTAYVRGLTGLHAMEDVLRITYPGARNLISGYLEKINDLYEQEMKK